MKFNLILTTTPNKKIAKKLAIKLIKANLCSCVNIKKNIISIYKWKDKITKDKEVLMLIKARENDFKKINKFIKANHPYKTPEIIALKINKGDKKYLKWIFETTKESACS